MFVSSLIAALALQGAAADVTDVQIVNRRPSEITSQMKDGQLLNGCSVEALDNQSKIRIHGPADARSEIANYIRLFDVKRVTVHLAINVTGKIDKVAYNLDVDVPNNEEFDFTESATGLKAAITPRVNADGSITFRIGYGVAGNGYTLVVRLKQNETYVCGTASVRARSKTDKPIPQGMPQDPKLTLVATVKP